MSPWDIALAPPKLDSRRKSVSSELLHDLRSPLNQIIGYSEMLLEEAQGICGDAFIADLGKIGKAGHRILSLLEENFVAVAGPSVPSRAVEEAPNAAPSLTHHTHVAPGLLLVVDDDAANRDVLSRRLIQQGHRVETASSGREALEMMRATPFDVLLLDIMMPDMDGYEVLAEVKADERLQHVPVVMISALSEVESVIRCLEAGAEDFLSKPFDPALLRARIGSCLDKKRGRDRETALYGALQENYQRLQEVEQLRDDMRNMIVHDLRTPLTSVIVGVEMLDSDGTLTDDQRETMHIALGSGRTLLGMINDLLDVEKMESGSAEVNLDSLSAEALIRAAVAQVLSLATEAGTVIEISCEADLPEIRGEENKLSRTLVNLIGNAIKFTGVGTVVVAATREKDCIRFAVTDSGPGIAPEAFHRIFEKFGQLDSRKVGTGLGLAFCKLAVEAHGGVIDVKSTEGKGSTFSFTIPIVDAG